MYEAKVSSSAPSRLVLSPFCRRQRAAVPVASRSLVHTPLVWQVLKAEYWQKGSNKNGAEGPHYFVHYKGWKQTCVLLLFLCPGWRKTLHGCCTSAVASVLDACNSRRRGDTDARLFAIRWDEWVPEERLNKYNEEGVRKQKALIEAQRARDAAEREALKAEEAAKAKSIGIVGVPGPAGRGTARGQKRGRDGEGVRLARVLSLGGSSPGVETLANSRGATAYRRRNT